ncbi:hypothetical protein C1Y29_18765 [Pseudomonas sp. MPBD4-3]|nr:hypothetical protein C1Y29_18765 [Pseudomonas sp. MPBD4-3]
MYSLEDLLHLMNRLRDPQYGCPWDIKQHRVDVPDHRDSGAGRVGAVAGAEFPVAEHHRDAAQPYPMSIWMNTV